MKDAPVKCNLCEKRMIWKKEGNALHFCMQCWKSHGMSLRKLLKDYWQKEAEKRKEIESYKGID